MDTDSAPSEGGRALGRFGRVFEVGVGIGVCGLATVASFVLSPWITHSDQVMLYVLGVAFVAYRLSFVAALGTAISSIAAFDFFFVRPLYSLAVESTQYLLTFVVMGVLSVAVSALVWRVREEAEHRERLSAAARDARIRLETEQLRNSLLSAISHDLRTPLASIIGTLELLNDERTRLTADSARELLVGAQSEAQRLSRLLENILDLTRIEGGGLQLSPQWLVPEETIGAVLRRLGSHTSEHRIVPRVETDLGYYDEPSVETALFNLVENALRYSPAGTTVDVMCRSEEGALVFEVVDEGAGFDPGSSERLFDKFSRGRGVEVPGTGLGLAIVDAVARAHGGAPYAELRDPAAGSRFGIRLPQSAPPPAVDDSAIRADPALPRPFVHDLMRS